MNETTKEHTMKQVHIPHTDCDHPKTPKARAVCRRLRRQGAPETSKAEIVARVKGGDITPVRTTIQSSEKSNKRSKKADAPVLRELLTLDETPMLICEDPDCEGHTTQDDVDRANALIAKHTRVEACEQDEVPVNVNVIAKGSKVVHMPFFDGAEDGTYLFACTKREVNINTATITSDAVTCKNCLKLSNK